MGRPGGPGPLDPIFDVETEYGVFAFDNTPGVTPLTVTINQAPGQSDPTSSTPILFEAVFSRATGGFGTGDVTITGTAGATTGVVTEIAPFDGTTYQVSVSGMTGPGSVTTTIASFVCTATDDGTPNSASTSTDNTVSYTITAAQTAIVATGPKRYYTCEGNLPFDDFGTLGYDATTQSGTVTLGGETGDDGRSYLLLGNTGAIDAAYTGVNGAWPFAQNAAQTFMVMLKPVSVAGGTQIVCQQSDGTNRRGWLYISASRMSYNGQDNTGTTFYQTPIAPATPIAGAWHLYFFRQQGVNEDWYRDNVLQSNVGPVGGAAELDAVARFELGNSYAGGMAHIAMWDSFLSTTDMTNIYNAFLADGWSI